MKSKINQSSTNTTPNPNVPFYQRKLKTKPTLILLLILFLGNIFWFLLWAFSGDSTKETDEQVASVGKDIISRQQWMAAMEQQYGKETLRTLVNEAVMESAAEKYKIKVTDEEIELEIALLRSAQDSTDTALSELTDKQLKKKIRNQLILEKVLTKDLVIEDKEVKQYFDSNQSLFNIPTTYKTKFIMTNTADVAKSVIEEVESGSDFSALAREKSLDSVSASLGGSIGYIYENQPNIDSVITKAAAKLKVDEISDVLQLSDGHYAVILVEEVLNGKSFKYEEVKDHIKRTLALQQLPSSISVETFWEEFDAQWIYGN